PGRRGQRPDRTAPLGRHGRLDQQRLVPDRRHGDRAVQRRDPGGDRQRHVRQPAAPGRRGDPEGAPPSGPGVPGDSDRPGAHREHAARGPGRRRPLSADAGLLQPAAGDGRDRRAVHGENLRPAQTAALSREAMGNPLIVEGAAAARTDGAAPPAAAPRARGLRAASATLSMIKFQHTLFALPFAFTGAILAADGLPSPRQIGWILGAMVGARSAAMIFNRIADLDFDRRNPRTASRPLVTGELGLGFAWSALALSVALFFLSAFRLNRLSFLLAAPAILLVLSYSCAKPLS